MYKEIQFWSTLYDIGPDKLIYLRGTLRDQKAK